MWLLCRNIEMQRDCIGENLANLKRIAEVINLQSENGVVRKTDYSRVLVNIDNVQTEYEGVQELLMQQLRVLKYLIGMGINENVKLTGNLPDNYTIESQNSIDISDRTAQNNTGDRIRCQTRTDYDRKTEYRGNEPVGSD